MHFRPFHVPGVHLLHCNTCSIRCQGQRVLKKITQYKFIGITHFLMDVIPISTQLNLVFQKEDLDLAPVTPVVETTLQHVEVACQRGKHQRELKEKTKQECSDCALDDHVIKVNENQQSAVQTAKDDFVVALEVNFQKRSPKERMRLTSAFEVLSLRSLSIIPSA